MRKMTCRPVPRSHTLTVVSRLPDTILSPRMASLRTQPVWPQQVYFLKLKFSILRKIRSEMEDVKMMDVKKNFCIIFTGTINFHSDPQKVGGWWPI